MSVPVNQRSHGKLEAAVKARDLTSYTLKITANKKIFAEEYQEALTDRIVASAIAIHTKCWSANNVLVNSREDMAKRLSLQEEAAIECNNLLSLIELAQPVGAHDSYMKDDQTSHNGYRWISEVDNNVWEPGVYGWRMAGT